MPSIGLLLLEIHIEHSHSLKDKRQVLRSIKDRLRKRLNIAVAELDHQNAWQRSQLGVVTVSPSQSHAENTLDRARREAELVLGNDLVSAELEFL